MKYVIASQAQQDFFTLLAEAAAGAEIIITRRGAAIAKLGPARPQFVNDDRKAAVDRLLTLLDVSLGSVRFRRDELYDR